MHECFNLQFIFEIGKREKKYPQNQANSNKVNPKYEPDLALICFS